MNKTTMIYLVAALLAGCVTAPQSVVRVNVPVPVPCVIEHIDKPPFAVDALSIDPPAGVSRNEFIWQQMQALLADRVQRQAYENILEQAIKSCQ